MSDLTQLKKIGFLRNLDDGLLECLAPALTKAAFKDGAVIFKENDPGGEMYFITSGQVEITKSAGGPSGASHVLSVLGEGGFFGEMALIDKLPRSATARAKGETVLWTLNREDFEGFLKTDTRVVIGILGGLLSTMVERLREMDQRFVAVYETGQILAGQEQIATLLEEVLQKALSLVPRAQGGFIALRNEFTDLFELLAVKGGAIKGTVLEADDVVTRFVQEHRECLVVEDASRSTVFPAGRVALHYGRSFVLQPLIHRGDLLGFLVVYSNSQKLQPASGELNLLATVASQVAPVVANARKLVEEENRRRLRQTRILP